MVRFFVRVVRQRKGGIGDSSCEPRGTQIVPLDLPENAQVGTQCLPIPWRVLQLTAVLCLPVSALASCRKGVRSGRGCA